MSTAIAAPFSESLSLAALVLAGGKSSRMGKDKALIPWRGIPLLQRVYKAAATCCQQVYVCTPWPQRYQNILPEDAQFLSEEATPGQGPLVALSQGLTQISAPWILLLACDLPRLEPILLRQWAMQLNQVPETVLALVPRQLTQWEPLCGFYRREAQLPLQQFIQQGGRCFQTWLVEIPVQPLPVDKQVARMLWNCNRPEDLSESS
jgi:molybdopterin-guanine dinucleotide biosynthesis protein A